MNIEQTRVNGLLGRVETLVFPGHDSHSRNMENDEAYLSSPNLLATSLIDNLIDHVTEDQSKLSEDEDVDSGKELLQTMANMQKELPGVPENEYTVKVDFSK